MQNIEISRFDIQRDLVTRTGERGIGAVSRRLPDNPGEWAYIKIICIPGTLDFTGSEQMVPYNTLHTVTNILSLSME